MIAFYLWIEKILFSRQPMGIVIERNRGKKRALTNQRKYPEKNTDKKELKT